MHIAHPFGEKYAHLAFTKETWCPIRYALYQNWCPVLAGEQELLDTEYTLYILHPHTLPQLLWHTAHIRTGCVLCITGLSHALENMPPACFLPSLRSGRAFKSCAPIKKVQHRMVLDFFGRGTRTWTQSLRFWRCWPVVLRYVIVWFWGLFPAF